MYFDAVMSVVVEKLDCGVSAHCSRLLGGSAVSSIGYEESGLSVDPRVWKLLLNIDTKLDLILDKLTRNTEGLDQARPVRIVLDDANIIVNWHELYAVGSLVRIKMWLPMRRLTGIVVGAVVEQVVPDRAGGGELRCLLSDVSDEVSDKLIEFAIDKQREDINKRKRDSV